MKDIYIRSCVIFALFAGALNSYAAIMSSEVRAEKLASIHFAVKAEVKPLERDLIDVASSPFVPDLGKLKVAEDAPEPVLLSEEELLEALSQNITPTGIFLFGGDFYLVFSEKKLKVGSALVVNLNDTDYNVTIEEITGSAYQIRLGESVIQLKLK